MSVIGRYNDIAIAGLKFETPIATTESKTIEFYQNTLYPYLHSLVTDVTKAFYFDVGSGNVQSKSAYSGITNKMQSYAPATAENGAYASVTGWAYHTIRKSIFFVTFYNSPTNGTEYAIHEYTIAAKTITTVSVVTHATGSLTYTPPNQNSLFIDETAGKVYFVYNNTNTLTGKFAYLDIATGTISTVTSFAAARTDYDEIHLRDMKRVSDYIIIVGDMVDTAGTENDIGFIYIKALASMPATVNVNAGGASIYLSDTYFPSAVCEFNSKSVVAKDTISDDFYLHGVIFAKVKISSPVYSIAATFRYQYVDSAIDFEAVTVIDSVFTDNPGQSMLLERKSVDRILLSDNDSAYSRALKSLTMESAGRTAGGTRGTQYSSLAVSSSLLYPYIAAKEFSLTLSLMLDGATSGSKDILNFVSGTTASPVATVGRLRFNAGSLEFYIADAGATLRLAASTAALSLPSLAMFEVTIARDKYGVWSVTFNGTTTAVTNGVGSGLSFGTGDHISFYGASAGEFVCYKEFTFVAEGVVLFEGIPGSQATKGGVYAGISDCRVAIEMSSFYSQSFTGVAGGFDVDDNGDEDVRVFFCGNMTASGGSSLMYYVAFDYKYAGKSTNSGCDFGLSGKGARILAPCFVPADDLLYPILCAPLDLSVASPLLDFVITRMDTDLTFAPNAADIPISFVTSHASIVAGTEQIDNLAFYDNALVASVSNFPLLGLPFTALTLIDPPYPIVIQGEPGHVDFLRRKSSPTVETMYSYSIYRSGGGTRYNYSPSLNNFYASAGGFYKRDTITARMQDEFDEIDAYVETPNLTISQILEEVKSEAIELYIKVAVSQLKIESSWTSDSNYAQNTEKKYQNCGNDEENARLDTGSGTTVRFAGSKQVEIKDATIDQRTARSFKVRVAARITDTSSNKYYDDFKIFHIMVKTDPGIAVEGDRTDV